MGKKYNLSFMELLEKIDGYDLGTVVESEKGEFYKLTSIDCTREERKFARMKDKGTSLRFMTYDNFRKKFRIVEEEKGNKNMEEVTIKSIFIMSFELGDD